MHVNGYKIPPRARFGLRIIISTPNSYQSVAGEYNMTVMDTHKSDVDRSMDRRVNRRSDLLTFEA